MGKLIDRMILINGLILVKSRAKKIIKSEAESPARGGQASEDGAVSGWGHSRACPELVEGLPSKISSYFFVKSPHYPTQRDVSTNKCSLRYSSNKQRRKVSLINNILGRLAQLARASDLHSVGRGFKSLSGHIKSGISLTNARD